MEENKNLAEDKNNSGTVASYNFACGRCKDCKYWDKEVYGAGESNERQCKRVDMNGSAQFIDNDNWNEMPGAYIWIQTETEDGLGGEVIGVDKLKKEVYINSPLTNFYREKINCDFITTAEYGCALFESKQ